MDKRTFNAMLERAARATGHRLDEATNTQEYEDKVLCIQSEVNHFKKLQDLTPGRTLRFATLTAVIEGSQRSLKARMTAPDCSGCDWN